MDIVKLRSVLAAVKLGSVSEASYELYITQSSVSKNIQAVERELGVKLFKHSGRQLVLTMEGKKLMPYIEDTVVSYDSLLKKSGKLSSRSAGKIVVASTPIRSGINILEMIKAFKEAFPSQELELSENHQTSKLLHGIDNGSIDVAIPVQTYISSMICEGEMFFSPKYRLQPFLKDYYYAVVYKNHPLAAKREVSLSDFRGEPFISVGSKFEQYHSLLAKAAKIYDIDFNIVCYGDSISSVIDMVDNEMGISILSSRVFTPSKNVVLIPIREDLIRVTNILVKSSDTLSPQLEWFLTYAKNHYALTSKQPQ